MLRRSDAEKDFAKLGTAWWLGGAVCVGLLRRVMPDGAPGCSVDSRGTLRVCGLPAQPTQRSAIRTASSWSPSPRPSAQPALPAGARGRATADREYERASCRLPGPPRGSAAFPPRGTGTPVPPEPGYFPSDPSSQVIASIPRLSAPPYRLSDHMSQVSRVLRERECLAAWNRDL